MKRSYKGAAYNFSYLMFEYYKKFGLNEREVMILLEIDHLNESGISFVTSEILSEYMNYTIKEIDSIMNDLFLKKFIEIGVDQNKIPCVNIEPFKNLLFVFFQKDVLGEEEARNSEEMEEFRLKIYSLVESLVNRDLTPFEIGKIDEWIQSGTEKEIILSAIEEAKRKNQTSITQIDRLIIKKLRDEDNYGNSK